MSCRMAAWPQSQRRKIFVFFRELGIQRGEAYTACLPGEGKGVLNKRERNVLDIHYGLMKAPPLKQISGWAFGFGSVRLSVSLSVSQSVCLSGAATFFFLPDALSASCNNMFAVCFYILVSWSTDLLLVFLFEDWKEDEENHSSEKRLNMSYDMLLLETAWNRSEPLIPCAF